MSDKIYQWYYGVGAEPEYFYGGYGSREEATRAGWLNYPEGDFAVTEADKEAPSYNVMPADWIIERYEEYNEQCWGEDGADIAPTPEQERELEALLGAALELWMKKHDLSGRVWSFGHTRSKEYFGPVVGNVAHPATSVSE